MKVIATIHRSAGNDSVGEMWDETAVFDEENTIMDVFRWADSRCHSYRHFNYDLDGNAVQPPEIKPEYLFGTNVHLSVQQNPADQGENHGN